MPFAISSTDRPRPASYAILHGKARPPIDPLTVPPIRLRLSFAPASVHAHRLPRFRPQTSLALTPSLRPAPVVDPLPACRARRLPAGAALRQGPRHSAAPLPERRPAPPPVPLP